MNRIALLLCMSPLLCRGITNFVSLHGASVPPYTNWAMAATNIQLAVDYARDGDTVLVSNGLYNSGSRYTPGSSNLQCRVAITNAILLKSFNGPSVTAIVGAPDPATGWRGTNATRCVHLGLNAHLAGFTVSNGYPGDEDYVAVLGSAIYAPSNATISECYINENVTGGGSCIWCDGRLTLSNSTICNNRGDYNTGCSGIEIDCYSVFVASNISTLSYASTGLQFQRGWVDSSTICANRGGGIGITPHLTVRNCIIWGNQQQVYNAGSTSNTYCCIQDWLELTDGTISNDPQFVDAAAMDYRLRDTSPCINAGTNMPWMWAATDLDGAPRIQHGIVDMGCYESAVPEPFVLVALILCLTALGRRAR